MMDGVWLTVMTLRNCVDDTGYWIYIGSLDGCSTVSFPALTFLFYGLDIIENEVNTSRKRKFVCLNKGMNVTV